MDETPEPKPKLRRLNNLGLKIMLRSLDAGGALTSSDKHVRDVFDLELSERDKATLRDLKAKFPKGGKIRLPISSSVNARLELQKFGDEIKPENLLLNDFGEPVVSAKSRAPAPPSVFWFELLVPVSLSQDFLINLKTIYSKQWVPKYGWRKAKVLWRMQCAHMAFQYWVGRAIDVCSAIQKFIG